MKKKLSMDEVRLESLLRIAQYQAESEQDLLDFALNQAIALTKSAIGYIYFYDDKLRAFTLNTWSKGVMDVCAIREPQTKYNLDQTGIWGEAVRQACPIILNDFKSFHPLKKGCPEGHASIFRFLTLPVFHNQHIVAVIGLANKKRNYTDADIRQVQILMSSVWQIAQRQRFEDALRRSEERYRSILETMAEGYTENDLEGNLTFANDAACKMLGYEHDELVGSNFRRIHSPDTAKAMYKNFHRIFETGKPLSLLDYEVICKDGSLRTFQSNATLLRNPDGKPTGFSIMTRDITERKLASEALKKSEEKYRTILETMAEGYTENDLQGNYIFANDAACKQMGYSRNEIIGMNYRQIHPPDTARKVYDIFHRLYETGNPEFLLDYEMIVKDGSVRTCQSNAALIRDASGKPIGFSNLARDITDRKRTEDELRRSEERYRTILETMEEGYLENDLKGNYIFFNDTICRLLGYTRDEMIGMSYWKIHRPDVIQHIKTVYKRIYETGKPEFLLDFEVIHKDGSAKVLQSNIALMRDAEGNPSGFRAMVRDVTKRKRAEEELARSEERIRVLFNNMPVPTFVWKAQKDKLILVEFNDAALQFSGGKILGFIGRTVEECYAHSPQIPGDMQQCFSSRANIEKSFWFSFDDISENKYVIMKYAFAPPDNIIMHVNDITAQKRAEENLHYISIHDSLTGLYNRFYADAEIDRIVTSRLRPVSVISIDLNNLKTVNDQHGHATGDLYIRNAASLLKQTFRPEDLVARIGGDEFIVILPSVDEQVCTHAIRRLKENLEILNKVVDQPLSLAAGVSTAHSGDDFLQCIKEADRRMYEEKANWKKTGGKIMTVSLNVLLT
jgi:diguanylate cyclase (GGDEF)-like protein/PAS domain S-box-containing protein